MEKIYLQKIEQFDTPCYIGKIDPRKLVKMAQKIEMGAEQDAQRPLNEKRVKDIAKYVSAKGLLPSTLTIATTNDMVKVQKVEGSNDTYYINIPTTDDEFKKYEDSFDVMDGQHRLYSFLQEVRQLSNNDKYEIGFTLYITPSLSVRRQIFITCNEKQEKVSGNLLMWFKYKLSMLTPEDAILFNIVTKLNESYPLKGRIIMAAGKVKNGLKAKEIVEIIKKYGINDLQINGNSITDEKKVQIINDYLIAWQNAVGFTYSSAEKSTKSTGAATKIAGLRYMLKLLPSFFDKAVIDKQKFNSTNVEINIKRMISKLGCQLSTFFTCDENKLYFASRSSTEQFAEKSKSIILQPNDEEFDPLA